MISPNQFAVTQALEDIKEIPRELLLKALFHGELLAETQNPSKGPSYAT